MTEWKKTFVCAFTAQVLSILGFSFALPFLPFFIADLGITDPAAQAWWAGVILAGTGFTLAIFAPVWGILADKYGRKKMVMRSMFGGTIVLLLMSFSRNIGELFIARLLQGALTGTVSASIALVASVTPPKRSGFTLGMMQSAVFVGVAIGPLLGGLVADAHGYRTAFRVGAVIIFLGGLLIQLGATESFAVTDKKDSTPLNFRGLINNKWLVSAIFILFIVRYANTIVNPSFPLIIKDIITRDVLFSASGRLNSITGSVMAFAGLAGAVSAGLLGYIGDRFGYRSMVVVCSMIAAVTAAGHALAQSVIMLTIIHLFFGMAIAGILPAVNAIIQRTTEQQHMGKVFGIASSISMIGLALGPLTGGFLAKAFGIRAPFIAAGVTQLVVAVVSFNKLSRKRN